MLYQEGKFTGGTKGLYDSSGKLRSKTETKKPSALEKTGSIFGKVGKFLGEATGVKGVYDVLKEGVTTKKPLKELIPRAAGSAAKVGLTLGTFGAGLPTTAAGRIGLGAATGAGFGGGEALETGKPVLKEVAKGAAFGVATFGAVEGASSLLRKTPQIAERMMSSAFRITKNNLKKNPSIAKDFIAAGFKGSIEDMQQQALTKLNNTENSLQQVLKGIKDNIPTKRIATQLEGLKKNLVNVPGERDSRLLLDQMIQDVKSYGRKITAEKANEIKRGLYDVLQTSYGKEATVKRELQKTLARLYKEEVEKVGGPIVTELNQKLRVAGRAAQFSKDALAGGGRNIFGLGDIAGAGFGAAAGAGTLIGGPIGAAVGLVARRIAESPQFKTRGAITIAEASKFLGKANTPLTKKVLDQLIKAGIVVGSQ